MSQEVVKRPFAWWTVPVAIALWILVLWTLGVLEIWGGDASTGGGFLRVRVVRAPGTIVSTLLASLALVAFADHLRRVRGLSR